MLLFLRKLLFYLFLIVYLILTPWAIFYAMGYIYNPSGGGLAKTGLVSIETFPKGATVYVGGRRYAARTPSAVRDLTPGRYRIRITHKGFRPWEKDIEIEPEKATRLDPVVLIPEKPRDEILSARPYRDLLAYPSEFKILAWESRGVASLWKIDLLFNRETRLDEKIASFRTGKITGVGLKKNSRLVLLRTSGNAGPGLLAYHWDREAVIADLASEADVAPEAIDWDPKNPGVLYFLKEGTLYRKTLRSEDPARRIASSVLGFGVKHDRLTLLTQDLSLYETDTEGRNPEQLLEGRELGRKIFGAKPASFYKIEILKREIFRRDLLFFLADGGALLTNWLPYQLVSEGVRGYEYGTRAGEGKVLYWTAHEIGLIDFSEDAEGLFEREPAKTVLVSGAGDVRQVFWAYEDTHILYRDGTRVMLLETQGPEPREPREVALIAPGTHILYSDRSHAVYFLAPSTRYLVKRRLSLPT